MKQVIRLIVWVHLCMFWACEPQVLDIDLEPEQPVYVIDAVVSNASDPVFHVRQTMSKLSPNQPLPEIVKGTLRTSQQTFHLEKIDSATFALPGFKAQKGEVYQLLFENLEGTTIQAETTMPQAELKVTVSEEPSGSAGIKRLRIHFKNENAAYFCIKGFQFLPTFNAENELDTVKRVMQLELKSYYSFVSYFMRDDTWMLKPELNFADANTLPNSFMKLFFTDKYFVENELDVVVEISASSKSKKTLEIEVLNADYWAYIESLQTAQQNQDNEFATPVQLFSNVKNGTGLFAAKWQIMVDVP